MAAPAARMWIDLSTGQYVLHGLEDPDADKRAAVYREWCEEFGGGDVFDDMHAPSGFPNRTDTSVSFNNGTRTLTLAKTNGSFDIYLRGVKHTFTSDQTKQITDTEGVWWFYFDASAVLNAAQTIPDFRDSAFVAIIYWNAAGNVALDLQEERHGITMDGDTHRYLHNTVGVRWVSGLAAGDYTTAGDGDSDSDAQLSIGDGVIHDEDIRTTITDDSPQNLAPIAWIPVYYLSGATPVWRKTGADAFPVIDNATDEIRYNLDSAGTWSNAIATNNYHVAMWIFTTPNVAKPVIALLGQRQDQRLDDARENNKYESLVFNDLPFQEMKLIYRLIFNTRYPQHANTPHCKLVDIQDLRSVSNLPAGTYVATAHNSLTGRDVRNAHPASAVRLDLSNFGFLLSGLVADTTDDVQSALDVLDDILENTQTVNADWTWGTTSKILFRDAAIHISSANDSFLDLVADGAIRLTTTGTVALTVPGNGALQVAGDLWCIDSGGDPRIVLGDSSSAGAWGGMRWVSASDSIGIGTDTGGVDTLLISEAGDVLLAGTGRFQFGDAGTHIYQSADSILSYVADGRHEFTGGPVYVGSGSPGHINAATGNLFVADRLEVDGPAYFDDQTYFYGLMDCRNEHIMQFYGSTFGGLYRLGGDGLHFYVYGGAGSAQNRNIIICDYAARLDDYNHFALSPNPTFIVHSLTRAASETDEWWSITHDQTDAVYSVGSGVHKFTGDMLSHGSAKHYFDAGAAIGTEYITSGADTYIDIHWADADSGVRFYSGANLLGTISRYSGAAPGYFRLDVPSGFTLSDGGADKWQYTGTASSINTNLTVKGYIYVTSSGYLWLKGDYSFPAYGLFVGANADAGFWYNGTHAIIDPKKVGAGWLYIGPTANAEAAAAKWHTTVAGTEYAGSDAAGYYDIHALTAARFNSDIFVVDAKNIILDTTTGTELATAANQKLGFWGATPVVQEAHIADGDGTLAGNQTAINAILLALETEGILAAA